MIEMKRINNEGFSLIELIIVIAIMAVLVAIITPNLTKYLSKAKKGVDNKNLDEVHNAVMVAIADGTTSDPAVSPVKGGGSSAVYIFKYDSTLKQTIFDNTDGRNQNADANFAKLVVSQFSGNRLGDSTGKNKIRVDISVDSYGNCSVTQAYVN